MKLVYLSTFLILYAQSSSATFATEKTLLNKSNEINLKYGYRIQKSHETTTDDGTSLDVSTDFDVITFDIFQNNSSTLNNLAETVVTEQMIDISHLSAEFLNCTHIDMNPELYEELGNGSVYVPQYHMSFNRSNYLIRDRLLYLCPVFYGEYEDPEKFSLTLSTVSIVCMAISAVCIVFHMIMFVLVKRLRNLPGYVLLSLCKALLAAYLCTFIQYQISEQKECLVIGMLLLYFFLASFFWMNIMSYDVWRSIRMATSKFRSTADRPIMVRFTRYSVYSWGFPLMIILASIIVHNTSSNVKYQLIFDPHTCWFAYKQALTIYFAMPLFILLGLNVFFFISSFYMISSASMKKSATGSQNGTDLWARLFLSLRLCSVMGFMWLFGIIAAACEQEWLWYLYAACNALQGVFIFFSFTISGRTRKALKKALSSRMNSSMPTQSSTSQPTTTV